MAVGSLVKHLTYETQNRLVLHDWRPDYQYGANGKYVKIYSGKFSSWSLVVIEIIRERGEASRRDWYFGVIDEKPPWLGGRDTEESQYREKQIKLIKRKNRVPARELEQTVLKTIEELKKNGQFPN